ncbi:hypothetical protein [Streptomyces sp. NPDC051704]|uniref:hypothetical protein n=1 Tax=Streptomyces sp. NPDC051704 TaxID=3365671 RepID=UPI0037955F11
MITRNSTDFSLNVVASLMGISGDCGFAAMVVTRSFLPIGPFGALVLLGWGVVLVLPWRHDVASRRGARMKAAVSGGSGPRPTLPPGLVLDDEAHARFAGVALHAFGSYQLFESGGGGRRPVAVGGAVGRHAAHGAMRRSGALAGHFVRRR